MGTEFILVVFFFFDYLVLAINYVTAAARLPVCMRGTRSGPDTEPPTLQLTADPPHPGPYDQPGNQARAHCKGQHENTEKESACQGQRSDANTDFSWPDN